MAGASVGTEAWAEGGAKCETHAAWCEFRTRGIPPLDLPHDESRERTVPQGLAQRENLPAAAKWVS